MEEVILSTEQGDVVVPLIKGFVASPDETLLFQVWNLNPTRFKLASKTEVEL